MTDTNPTETKAAWDVLAERARQISVEGWTPEHDDQHDGGQLAAAAAAYASEASGHMGAMMPRAANDIPPHGWPWDEAWWKPKDKRSNLVRAAALLLAEIERIDRAEGRTLDGNAGVLECVCDNGHRPTNAECPVNANGPTFGVAAASAPHPLRHNQHLCADCTTEHACQHRLDLPRPCWGTDGVQPSDGGQGNG